MTVWLAVAHASTFEVEATTAYRMQTARALIDANTLLVSPTTTLTSGVRARVETENSRFALEVFGHADKLAPLDDEIRMQRWGGIRALLGFRGLTPLTVSHTHLRVGMAAVDVHDVRRPSHEPQSMATLGVDFRRFAGNRLQAIDAEAYGNTEVWGLHFRSRTGWSIRDTGLFGTIGLGTSRFQRFDAPDNVQVTYQIETSIFWRTPR